MVLFEDLAKLTVDVLRDEEIKLTNFQNMDGNTEGAYLELSEEYTLKEWRRKIVQKHFRNMVNTSSFHGIPHIFDRNYPIRRFIWFCVTIVFLCYSIQKVYESTVNYFEFPFNTAYIRKYVDKMDFPAVSFCNLNDMRMSVVNGTPVDIAILDHTKTGLVSSEEYHNTTSNAVHKLEEMLIDCKFDGKTCTVKNFTEFYWMEGDKCYTFNSGESGHEILSVDGSGLKKSLIFTVNIQHYDYYRDKTTAGLHLILHGQQETPVKIIGHMLSPGYTTYIKVEKKKVNCL